MMWAMIFISMILGGAAGFVYLISRFSKFDFVAHVAGGRRLLKLLAGMLMAVLMVAVLWFAMGYVNVIICVLHLVVCWLLCDLVFWIVKKKRKREFRHYYAGVAAILVTLAYLGVGWVQAHHVRQTNYTLPTDKQVGTLRIVLFADSHIGTTFDGVGFAEYVKRMQEQNPDVVLITGDFVDDDSDREDMIAACAALGNLQTGYGVYYVYGNHDKGYYGEKYRGFSALELAQELEKNGVVILEDETVLVDERFYIVGRKDYSEAQMGKERASAAEQIKTLDHEKYIIVMDHQPREYKDEAACGADLVLSGHTHGGQLIPITYAGEWMGVNDKTYDLSEITGTSFIVTSGISDWAIQFKTGCKSEYVVIDINGK